MLLLRLILMLVLIALFALIATYAVTKNKKYLNYILTTLKFLGITLGAMFVVFLLTRVIRF